jgi:hypothetical protein
VVRCLTAAHQMTWEAAWPGNIGCDIAQNTCKPCADAESPFYVGSPVAARRRKMPNCITTVAQWPRVEIST